MKWELALTVSTALIAGLESVNDDRSFLEIGASALFWGFASVGTLWLVVWCFYLIRAPGKLRKRMQKRVDGSNITPAIARITGRSSFLAGRARQLIPHIREFARVREMHYGRGVPSLDEGVADRHREILRKIESFGATVAEASLEHESRSGRRQAMQMYEDIRGFEITTDAEVIIDRIQEYTAPPESPFSDLRFEVRRKVYGLWSKVT